MSITEKDIKLLWGRAGNRCSFPDCKAKLTQDKSAISAAFTLGEQAHIVAEELNGPRGNSVLTTKERNSYANLILLCPTHHTLIDKNPQDYPAEKLHVIKAQHELWVDQILSESSDVKAIANNLIYTTLIDEAVEACRFEEWEAWTSYALEQPPEWDAQAPIRLFKFRQRVMGAAWPGTLPELENALKTLSIVMAEAIHIFRKHAKRQGDRLEGIRFYKIDRWDEKLYAKLAKEYDDWIHQCSLLIFEATKAANWVADVVRKELNPMFFAVQGKFIVTHGPYNDGMYKTELLEYEGQEKQSLPDAIFERINGQPK